MSITYQNAGAVVYGTTTTAPTYPASVAAGDYLVLFVGNKAGTFTPTTPAGWTLLDTTAGGAGTVGNDSGPLRVSAYGKVAVGGESGALTVTTGAGVSWGGIFRLSNATGLWDVASDGGVDSTTGTAWSATIATDIGLTAGDHCLVGSAIPTDVGFGAQFTLQNIAATGAVMGTMVELVEPFSSTAQDIGGFVFRQPVTSGTSSDAAVITATASGTTTNVAGPSALVRLREVVPSITASPGSIGSDEVFGTAVIAATLTAAPTSIATGETFGAASVTAALTAAPVGVPAAESFGTLSVTTTLSISPSGIVTGEMLGAPTVSSDVTATPAGITTSGAFGTPLVTRTLTVAPSGIATGAAVGTPAIVFLTESLTATFNESDFFYAAWPNRVGFHFIGSGSPGAPHTLFLDAEAGDHDSSFGTSGQYTLANSSLFCRMYPEPPGDSTINATEMVVSSVTVGTDALISVDTGSGVIRYWSRVGYVDQGGGTGVITEPYDPTTHAWVRIRETAGSLYFDTSPDCVTWTTRRTLTTPAWVVNSNTLSMAFKASIDPVNDAYYHQAEFDNFNVVPVFPTQVGYLEGIITGESFGTPVATVAATQNSYNIFSGTPSVTAAADAGALSLGTEFFVTAAGWVTQIRFLQPSSGGSAGTRTCAIYSVTDADSGTMVAGPFTMPTPTTGAWCTYTLPTAYQLTVNQRYRVVVHHPAGDYPVTASFFTSAPYDTGNYVQGILTVPNQGNTTGADQGSYDYGSSLEFPVNSFNDTAYYSDVTVTDYAPGGPTILHRLGDATVSGLYLGSTAITFSVG